MPNVPENQYAGRMMTVQEVERILNVHGATVRRWIRDGTLEAIILPHKGDRVSYRIKGETIDALLNPPR